MNHTNDDEVPSVLTAATENATNISVHEASYEDRPAKYNNYGIPKYEKLSQYNRGWNGPRRENKKINHKQDNIAIFDALAGQLELTTYQKKRGRRTLERLDLGKIGRPLNLIAFAVCVLVANDDVVDGYRYWPRSNTADDDFKRVVADLSYDLDTILSAMLTVDDKRNEVSLV